MGAITTIKIRRGTAAEWAAANPVLAEGELGYITDSKLLRAGDGVSDFETLRINPEADSITAADIKRTNLFIKSTLVSGRYLDADGVSYVINTAYSCTDYIPIEPGVTYKVSSNRPSTLGYYYNSSKVLITWFNGAASDDLNAPQEFTSATASYVRLNLKNIFLDNYKVAKSSEYNIDIKDVDWLQVTNDNIENAAIKPTKLYGYIPDIATTINLFNKATIDAANYINMTTGAKVSNAAFPNTICSDYIPVEGSTAYKYNSDFVSNLYCEYDANHVYIRGGAGKSWNVPPYSITTQATTRYMIFNINTECVSLSKFYVIKSANFPTYPEVSEETCAWLESRLNQLPEANGRSPQDRFKNMNILVTGDSITEVNTTSTKRWHDYLKTWLGLGTVYNDGKSGTGLIKTYSTVPGIDYRIPDWTTNYGTDFNLILIMGNMNDGTSEASGDWEWIYGTGDAHKDDYTTAVTVSNMADSLWYALRYALESLITRYPNKSIGYIISTPRGQVAVKTGTPRAGYDTSCHGKTSWFEEWVGVIKTLCEHYSIPVLDLYHTSNLRPWNTTNNLYNFSNSGSTTGDGIHPNAFGHELIARKIYEFVRQYM